MSVNCLNARGFKSSSGFAVVLLVLCLAALLLEHVAAAPAPTGFGSGIIKVLSSPPSWSTVICAMVGFGTGIYLCFLGGSIALPSLSIIGFVTVSTCCSIVAWNVEPSVGYTQRESTYFSIWLGTGVAGAALSALSPPIIGLTAGAAFGGFVIGLWFVTLQSGGLVKTDSGRGVLYGLLTAAFGLIALYVEPRVISISTAVTGAFIFIAALDLLLVTGWDEGLLAFVTVGVEGDGATGRYVFDRTKWAYAVSICVFGLLGAVIQWVAERRRGVTANSSVGGLKIRLFGAVVVATRTKRRR